MKISASLMRSFLLMSTPTTSWDWTTCGYFLFIWAIPFLCIANLMSRRESENPLIMPSMIIPLRIRARYRNLNSDPDNQFRPRGPRSTLTSKFDPDAPIPWQSDGSSTTPENAANGRWLSGSPMNFSMLPTEPDPPPNVEKILTGWLKQTKLSPTTGGNKTRLCHHISPNKPAHWMSEMLITASVTFVLAKP